MYLISAGGSRKRCWAVQLLARTKISITTALTHCCTYTSLVPASCCVQVSTTWQTSPSGLIFFPLSSAISAPQLGRKVHWCWFAIGVKHIEALVSCNCDASSQCPISPALHVPRGWATGLFPWVLNVTGSIILKTSSTMFCLKTYTRWINILKIFHERGNINISLLSAPSPGILIF